MKNDVLVEQRITFVDWVRCIYIFFFSSSSSSFYSSFFSFWRNFYSVLDASKYVSMRLHHQLGQYHYFSPYSQIQIKINKDLSIIKDSISVSSIPCIQNTQKFTYL